MKTMKHAMAFIALVTALFGCAGKPAANPDEVSLNAAIRDAAARMENRLNKGTKVALINFTSPSQAFSEYVLDELSSVLVNNGLLVVVDRANLDKLRQELGFNMSGEVSDASMQEIGNMLGAQALVTGSLASIGDLHRIMFKAIMTESAAVVVQHPADIINDKRVQALLASGGGSKAVAYGGTEGGKSSGGKTDGSGQAAKDSTAQAAVPAAKVYKIGDTGPAGGLIFFDKGDNKGGWRYMEAAPADLDGLFYFATEEINYRDTQERGVGWGKRNTEAIMRDAAKGGGGFGWAAQAADAYTLNGFDDWFIPSRDELNWVYGNLHKRGLGNFRNEIYWSSTGSHPSYCYAIGFSDGYHADKNGGSNRYRARAVRQF